MFRNTHFQIEKLSFLIPMAPRDPFRLKWVAVGVLALGHGHANRKKKHYNLCILVWANACFIHFTINFLRFPFVVDQNFDFFDYKMCVFVEVVIGFAHFQIEILSKPF